MTIILYQFPISHYCEKVRWALDFKGLTYKTVNLLPGAHVSKIKELTNQTSVPVLQLDQQVLVGSSAILEFLEARYPQPALMPSDAVLKEQVLDWEKRLDEVGGPAVRLFCYFHLLQTPKQVTPLLTVNQAFYKRWLFTLMFSKVEAVMKKRMGINAHNATKAEKDILELLTEINERLLSNPFLVGDAFSRADLTASALFAPMFQPEAYPVPWPKEHDLVKPYQEWMQSNRPLLKPLETMYSNHRLRHTQ
ncbi:glutathione S-transferase family protein [Nitrincola nitratireducens]|uniref:Stringent starvation protein A n=1 Tax=Nitrincola nitratireducens TaxID=1229521 RepID=W9URE0_9GAMM|nr:glutathione S-transferase family protein [Nitrincola nitratireducens]EXJ09659.1 stringent starvation protein A [Nitrincola nitratireducens]